MLKLQPLQEVFLPGAAELCAAAHQRDRAHEPAPSARFREG
jgi:hypothetical protein